ncbi:putative RNA binding protein YcfA (HicA-like mRNA interferase family) [Kribbella sp. VKM Ac-2527]|uniref:Putative RNA binding protein YcfA (HicA-like mRNA interferase family) n=1 Tax=Kribbella caucasensis TaxID=2512215 RepID=A0A4R6KLZ9_9ACTN|nr:type II toxin-antitoxin system HicA family toxin [Kribbella sp. VKM Ac-2527]TDO52584.1 putative RNA binding protein YcfA (HicA-like mRNA interferase family) [Kribbella sp. VKM Ac-2527]
MPFGWKPKKASEVVKDLERAGFKEAKGRGKGSHRIFKGNGKTIVVPDHGSKEVAAGTMRNIAKQAGKTPEDLYGTEQKGRARELTPEEVNRGVTKAGGKPQQSSEQQSGNRRQSGRRRGQGRDGR